MPFRLNEFRAKIQFIVPNNFPALVYKACLATDTTSNTRYLQLAVCEALARDLDMDLDELIESLPPTRGPSAALFGGDRKAISRRAPRMGS